MSAGRRAGGDASASTTRSGTRRVTVDVCIVGAGAAGITLAAELANGPLRVALVDSGGFDPSESRLDAYRLEPGEVVTLDRDECKPWCFGGNTRYWWGNCRPLEEADFSGREAGEPLWPLTREELLPYYERAQQVMGLGDLSLYELPNVAPHLRHGPAALDERVVESRLIHVCPDPDFGASHRSELEAAENVDLVLRTRAVRLHPDESGGAIAAVELRGVDGGTTMVEAGVFVLATGGIENARLLLASSTDPSRAVCSSDALGRYFMDHWYFDFGLGDWQRPDLGLYEGQLSKEEPNQLLQLVDDTRVWAQLTLSEEARLREQLPGLSMWIVRRPRDSTSVHALRQLIGSRGRGAGGRELLRRGALVLSDPSQMVRHVTAKRSGSLSSDPTAYSLRVQIEQLPRAENRVVLSDELDADGQQKAMLRAELGEREWEGHVRGFQLVADALGLKGRRLARQMQLMRGAGLFGFFWHHMGTTRMSADPAEGVVDPSCRVHGIDNLYVAGCSVFPTGGTAGPTLTIVALALRIAATIGGVPLEEAASLSELG